MPGMDLNKLQPSIDALAGVALLTALFFCAPKALAQNCTGLLYSTQYTKDLCTNPDGTGYVVDYDPYSGASAVKAWDDAEWAAFRDKLIQKDTAAIKARLAQLDAVIKQSQADSAGYEAEMEQTRRDAAALMAHSKKACLALGAGFTWKRACVSPHAAPPPTPPASDRDKGSPQAH